MVLELSRPEEVIHERAGRECGDCGSSSPIFAVTTFADGVQTPSAEIFFAGGGPLTRLVFLDLSELNEALPGTEFSGDLNFGGNQAFLLQGSLGFSGGDLRFGGVDAQGTWTTPVTGGAFDQAELKLSYGGFLFEVLLNPTSRLPLFAGGIIGSGKLSLLLSNGAEGTFADLTGKPLLLELSLPTLPCSPT